MLRREAGAAYLAGFGHADDGRAVRVGPGPPGIPGAALTCPDDDQRDRCHVSDLPVGRARAAEASGGPGGPRFAGGQAYRICVLMDVRAA